MLPRLLRWGTRGRGWLPQVLGKGTRGRVFFKYLHFPTSFFVRECLSSPSVALGEEGLPRVPLFPECQWRTQRFCGAWANITATYNKFAQYINH
jgi:hypothetical protein